MKRWQIISVLLFSYFFFLIAGIPASRVLHYLQQSGSVPATITGVEGSIWNGHADVFLIPGQPKLENINWSINPFALMIARLSAHVEAEVHKQTITGHVSRNFLNGNVFASDVTTKLPASTLQKIIDMPFGELGGDVEIFLDQVNWQKDMVPLIEARIYWQHAKLTLAQTIDMGQVNITVLPNDANQTNVTLSNTAGDLTMNGEATIGTDRSYSLSLTMKPKDATGDVAQSLNLFAQRQADGLYRFKQNGNLRSLGF
ncbi:MAG TPA: type II secretion system protein N [Gammaproteobacteria bacterium]|nr:type II secretion system protein N [Gammaproteobacteria bacterium]